MEPLSLPPWILVSSNHQIIQRCSGVLLVVAFSLKEPLDELVGGNPNAIDV